MEGFSFEALPYGITAVIPLSPPNEKPPREWGIFVFRWPNQACLSEDR